MKTVFTILVALALAHTYVALNLDGELTKAIVKVAKDKMAANHDINKNANDPFLAKVMKNGFKSYQSTAKVEFLSGVNTMYVDGYIGFLATQLGVPANRIESFKADMELATFVDRTTWKEVDFLFNLGKGQAKFVTVLTALNPEGTMLDFIVADIGATFEIGDDVFISTSTKSSFFGLFSKTKLKIKKVPTVMTQKSIELIFRYFKSIAFEQFAKFRGIKY